VLLTFLVAALVMITVPLTGVFILAAVGQAEFHWVLLGVFVPTVLGVLTIMLFSSALTSIYAAVLYRYAAGGQAGAEFPVEELDAAFRLQSGPALGTR
jgi:hypothetical protein